MNNHPTIIWAALLVHCEGRTMDLSDAPKLHQECAAQMRAKGILQKVDGKHSYTLTSTGMSLATLLERLRDFSLGQ